MFFNVNDILSVMKRQVLHLMELHFFMEGVFDTPTSKTHTSNTPSLRKCNSIRCSPRYTTNRSVFMPLTQTTFWNTETEKKYRSSLNKQIIIMLVRSSNVKFTEQSPFAKGDCLSNVNRFVNSGCIT